MKKLFTASLLTVVALPFLMAAQTPAPDSTTTSSTSKTTKTHKKHGKKSTSSTESTTTTAPKQ
jgi:hypothetical protein